MAGSKKKDDKKAKKADKADKKMPAFMLKGKDAAAAPAKQKSSKKPRNKGR